MADTAKLPSLQVIGKTALERRRKVGLSQKALAELAGVSHVTVIALEKGRGFLKLEGAWRILTALGLINEQPED